MALRTAAGEVDGIEGPGKHGHAAEETEDISCQHETPTPQSHPTHLAALKGHIRQHYELTSDYYYSLWGEHIHHGYFLSPDDTKETAQVRLIELLLERSRLPAGSSVLDVGCGIGGTTRHLAKKQACNVVGLTISGRQVDLARRLTLEELPDGQEVVHVEKTIKFGQGSVRFLELDADKLGDFFNTNADKATFDCVWISEAMSHLPDKALFFRNAATLLNPGGKLVVADWFKAEGLTTAQLDADIKPIEDGMLLPPLCSQSDYLALATQVRLDVFSDPLDISKDVSKTW